ncbi:MAG: dienelactone hydrolase family protein [Alphaproteobacteria bacterium]|nr:dienelactone hydrolase family protein [Alphaproteobacteria bacterium]
MTRRLRRLAAALVLALGTPASAAALELPYAIDKPAGDGPFPAVVLLHDCSGLGPRSSGAPGRWSSELTRRGYVTIRPDSFSTRGNPDGVCRGVDGAPITLPTRAVDAHGALAVLRTLAYVDPRRIGVMGGSHGGSSTLFAIVDDGIDRAAGGERFKAAVALYPDCGQTIGSWSVTRARRDPSHIEGYAGAFKPRAPLLILIGAKDDWTPAALCERLADAARIAGHPVELVVYPFAHHAFDSAGPYRYDTMRVNRYRPGGRGATTMGDAEAWADSIRRVETFFAHHLGGAIRAK